MNREKGSAMIDPGDGTKKGQEQRDEDKPTRQPGSFSLLRVLVTALVLLFLIATLYENFLQDLWETQPRSKPARVKGDLRTLTIALETYYLDHNSYPAWSTKPARNAFGAQAGKNAELARMPTFLMAQGTAMITLTTPVSYVSSYFSDPFAPVKGATFCYWTPSPSNGTGYILWSPGPDKKYDITLDNVALVYNPAKSAVTPMLVELSYDSSNGTKSAGDIWRIKE